MEAVVPKIPRFINRYVFEFYLNDITFAKLKIQNMKFIKSLLALLIIAAFVSCNTPNRPKMHDIVKGTPTNADTVLLRSKMHATDSLSTPHASPIVLWR